MWAACHKDTFFSEESQNLLRDQPDLERTAVHIFLIRVCAVRCQGAYLSRGEQREGANRML